MISLTSSQQAAADKLLADPSGTRILTGPAGSGKTTMMEYVMARLEDQGRAVTLLAPTGAAAARLSERTGRRASTIHSAMYEHADTHTRWSFEGEELTGDELRSARALGLDLDRHDELVFSGARSVTLDPFGVAVIDEGSMIGVDLARDIDRNSGSRIIVADPYQLPPVNEDPGYNLYQPTAHLTEILRQGEGSAILNAATAIRNRKPWSRYIDNQELFWCQGMKGLIDWRAAWHGHDVTSVTYLNDDRIMINASVRASLGYRDVIAVGDRLVCVQNNTYGGWMNGELWDAVDARRVILPRLGAWWRVEVHARHWHAQRPPVVAFVNEQQIRMGQKWHSEIRKLRTQIDSWSAEAVYAVADAAGVDRPPEYIARGRSGSWFTDRVFVADYGYCTTVHKAQGNEWPLVAIGYSDAMNRGGSRKRTDEMRKLWYTAVTRARKRLVIFKI